MCHSGSQGLRSSVRRGRLLFQRADGRPRRRRLRCRSTRPFRSRSTRWSAVSCDRHPGRRGPTVLTLLVPRPAPNANGTQLSGPGDSWRLYFSPEQRSTKNWPERPAGATAYGTLLVSLPPPYPGIMSAHPRTRTSSGSVRGIPATVVAPSPNPPTDRDGRREDSGRG